MPPWVAYLFLVITGLTVFIVLRLKRKFIAAPNLHQAVRAAERLSQEGFTPIINLLGEHYHSREKIERTVDQYRYLIDLLAQSGIQGKISIKPTQIGLAFSKDLYHQNLIAILRRANTHNPRIQVEIDIENARYKHDTLGVFLEIPGEYDARQAVQVYFYGSSEKDIEKLLRQNRKIRLVKGAYAEGDLTPAQVEDQMRNCSQHLVLCARDPAIATVRDEHLLRTIIEFVTDIKTIQRDSFEIQMLYGRRDDLKRFYKAHGYRVAVYMPVGPAYKAIPYIWRRVKELIKSRFR